MSIYKKEASKEEMKREAVLRMEQLGLDSGIVQEFQEEGIVSLSEQLGQRVLLLLPDGEIDEDIRRFEAEYECLVYHVLCADNPMVGECRSLLFVSPTSSDWAGERKYIGSSKLVYAYSVSDMEEGVSEIMVEPQDGGLIRIG